MKKIMPRLFPAVVISFTLLIINCGGGGSTNPPTATSQALTDEQELGKKLFSDQNLSSNSNQSCSSCHDPASGFADPNVSTSSPVSNGSLSNTTFGNRNAPTSAYAAFIPNFSKITTTTVENTVSSYQGGQFLDGRAIDLVEQAKAPFLNPVEMNNGTGPAGIANVVSKVRNASYANDFLTVYGTNAFDNIESAYNNIATAIAAFEASAEMNSFSSKFDAVMAGTADFTESEARGFELFKDPNGAKCANCHTVNDPAEGSLFTDFNYFNIAVPANPENPIYNSEANFTDGGLGDSPAITDPAQRVSEKGKFRTPTLRNIALTAPYMHNGVFDTLEKVINHYDTTVATHISDPFPAIFQPEVDANIANELTQSLNLDNDDTDGNGKNDYTDLVNFMNTLTDGFQ